MYSFNLNISSIFSSLIFLKSGYVCELFVFKVIIRITFLDACNSISLISPNHNKIIYM